MLLWLLLARTDGLAFGGFLSKPRIVVSGPLTEVTLCAAKMAAKAGCEAYAIVPSSNERDMWRAKALMYGRKFANDGGTTGAKTIAGVEAIAKALETAEAVIFTCDSGTGPPTDNALKAVFGNAPKLKHVAMLSSLGGGKSWNPLATPLSKGEATLRQLANDKNVELSIIRCGSLKGGGPGEVATTGSTAGKAKTDYGLDKYYYDTLGDLGTATATMSYDRFTLGADVCAGDPLTMPNPLLAVATAGSFDPSPTDCSRVSAAAALVAAVRRPKGGEFTISAKASEQPPSADEWLSLLDQAAPR